MSFVSLPCRVCESHRWDFLFRKSGWNIVRCQNCGFVYTHPIPTREDLHRYYASGVKIDWRDEKNPELIEHFRPEQAKKDFCDMRKGKRRRGRIWVRQRRLVRWNRYLPQKGRFLDVGCAEGYLVIAAQKRKKWYCAGVDVQMHRMARGRLQYSDLPLCLGLADQLCFKEETFDIMTMTHLLEHTFDPLGTLLELFRVLRKEGVVVVTVPDVAHPIARLMGKNWRRVNPPVHLWYFSLETLVRIVEKAAFKVIYNERSLLRGHVTIIGRKSD